MEQKCKEIQDIPEETLGKVTNKEPYLLLGSLDLFLGLIQIQTTCYKIWGWLSEVSDWCL